MLMVSIRVKNIDSSLRDIFSEQKAFRKDKRGGFYNEGIILKDDDNQNIQTAIKEALHLIETNSDLFMNVYITGGETELYITYRQSDSIPFSLAPETLVFMSNYGISLGVD